MDHIAAASGTYTCFRSDLVELRPCCTLLGRLGRQLLLLLYDWELIFALHDSHGSLAHSLSRPNLHASWWKYVFDSGMWARLQ